MNANGSRLCIHGHGFTAKHVRSLLDAGWTLEQIQVDFPFVEAAAIKQAVAYWSAADD